jgi:hypothetical protein
MLILPGLDQSEEAYLVFEATFDGSKDEFLDDLLRVAPKRIHAIYKNCDGYPESGLLLPARDSSAAIPGWMNAMRVMFQK